MMPSKNDKRHMQIGGRKRALSRYAMLKYRTSHTNTNKNKCYVGVEVRVEKNDFIEWFMRRDFRGCSVDRVDKNGHYELSNMQVISLAENIAKDKIKAINGMCRCYVCGEDKNLDDFSNDRRRITTGKSTICKKCDSSRKCVNKKNQASLDSHNQIQESDHG